MQGFKICQKLRILKDNIKTWNKEVFGHIEESREALSKVVEALDKDGKSRELSSEEIIMSKTLIGGNLLELEI